MGLCLSLHRTPARLREKSEEIPDFDRPVKRISFPSFTFRLSSGTFFLNFAALFRTGPASVIADLQKRSGKHKKSGVAAA
tara:strand:- start:11048 stop:11287 length:240 start_codon:yes stop_codon:yes gene_type:complete